MEGTKEFSWGNFTLKDFFSLALVAVGFFFMSSTDNFFITVLGACILILPLLYHSTVEVREIFALEATEEDEANRFAVKKEAAIDEMYSMARKLAKEFSAVGKEKLETQEAVICYIKQQYKDFRPETKWSNDSVCIEFIYRFAHPCVSIRTSDGAYAEVEARDIGEGMVDIVSGIYSKRVGRSLLELLQNMWENKCSTTEKKTISKPRKYKGWNLCQQNAMIE